MPSYKDLLKLIRQGMGAERIVERLDVSPYRLRQMLASVRLAHQLAVQEELAKRIARHQAATDVQTVIAKLREIAFGEKSETARKACLALLAEGFAGSGGAPSPPEAVDTNANPLDLLAPADSENADDDDSAT